MVVSQDSLKSFYKQHRTHIKMSGRIMAILQFIPSVIKGGTVLDVGCGNRLLSIAMCLYAKDVTGLTIENDICNFATDKTYDTVTCFDVLEHILKGQREQAIDNICKLAKHSVVLNIPDHQDKSQVYDEKVDILKIIQQMISNGFKINYFTHYNISDKESYNFMEFIR